MARTAAYTLVQYVYEHVPAEEVKSHIMGPAGGEQVSSLGFTSLSHTACALAHAEVLACPRVYNLGRYSLRSCCCSSLRLVVFVAHTACIVADTPALGLPRIGL